MIFVNFFQTIKSLISLGGISFFVFLLALPPTIGIIRNGEINIGVKFIVFFLHQPCSMHVNFQPINRPTAFIKRLH